MSAERTESKGFIYNSATFSGCLDVVVVGTHDKQYRSSNFMLTIGKMKLLNVAGKEVTIWVNGYSCKHKLKVNHTGNAYFDPAILTPPRARARKQQASPTFPLSREPPAFPKDSNPTPKVVKTEETDAGVGLNDTDPDLDPDPYRLNSVAESLKDASNIQMALCAHLIKADMSSLEIEDVFDQHRLTFSKFQADPHAFLRDPNLMIRIDGKIYDSFLGIPQLLALNAFKKELNLLNIPDSRTPTSSPITDLTRRNRSNPRVPYDLFEGVPLHPGRNEMRYVFIGNWGKEYTIASRLFFYPHQKQYRVIVSDIDGTVTRSDVLGHLMPMVGHDWAHDGICQLFTNLVKRGYIIIYLSARNIGQATRTKQYLASINQSGARMPEGPVLTSTEGLFSSLSREIVKKNPHVFKIKVLRGLYKVFSDGSGNPFYAAFGNKETDAMAYTTVSIETKRIFTINDKSEIKVLQNGSTVNFTNLNTTINDTFPEFNPDVFTLATEEEIRARNRTNLNRVVHQTLRDPLFKK
jgi:phosphatidate phosphatase PAH1